MRPAALVLAAMILAVPHAASAQSAKPSDTTIVVTDDKATRAGKPIAMSDWHVAEADHVLARGTGDRERLERIAHHLERLHFLLETLFDRVGKTDDTLKLRVTIIGNLAGFNQLGLTNTRWQAGPYPRRSAAVAAGNSGGDALVPELAGLLSDSSAVVRRHAAWALGRLERSRGARGARARARGRRPRGTGRGLPCARRPGLTVTPAP